MSRMKQLVFVAAVVAGLVLPVTAGAAVPCRDRIFNDWYHDGRVASSYPKSCYRDALKHVPADAKVYTSLSVDIKSAMLASLRRQHGKPAPKEVGHGLKVLGHGAVRGQLISVGRSSSPRDEAPGSVPNPATNGGEATASSPVADTSTSTPLPILVLGGLALLLAAAGAVGTGVRYARRRR